MCHLLVFQRECCRCFATGLSESLATVEGGGLKGQAGKAGLLKSLAVRAMSEAEYVSTGTLSDHQAGGKGVNAEDIIVPARHPSATQGYDCFVECKPSRP